MAPLKVHGPVRMRSMQTGITKWKEGSFEIVEKDNKVSLVVHYNVGGIPKTFQLSHNIKSVTLRPNGRKLCCLMLTLKDTSFLTIDKVPLKDANEMRMYLDAVHQDRVHTAKKDVSSPEIKKELLKKVKSAISATAERFSGYMQNDAHEFLSQCLDQLKEDMEKLNKTWKSEPVPNDDSSPGRASDDLSATKVYTCPVISNLEFEVQHSIICKTCGETVTKREQFNDLSIDLPRRKKLFPSRSIQDSLDLFFRAEEIEYSCEKCNGKSAVVTHKFNRLPRVLILHLKRYSFNVALSLNHKVGQQVVIPRYLTLLSHCTESTRLPLTLGWSAHSAIKYSFKSKSSAALCVDSDSDDEPLKRSVANSQRLCNIQSRDQQQLQEEPEKSSKRSKMEGDKPELGNAGFDGMSEDELLAAVLEISKREASLSLSHDEDKPTSSPDTGFGDDEIQELPENLETMETEKPKAPLESGPANFTEITKDFDENKENKTPEGSQGEVDWLQQYDMEREREEQELQQALAQSLQEQEAREQKEDDDLKRATELSLQGEALTLS
ncbi:UNVERIFIED_CONTAM: hypothetical protein H355_007763 [Colinus virginianus]|nr:hypothetical protein H355_007763 [Colinus virginianus]